MRSCKRWAWRTTTSLPASVTARCSASVSDAVPELEAANLRRVTRRLIPFMFVLYIANYLDRVNISFAALQMDRDLGLSSAPYGLWTLPTTFLSGTAAAGGIALINSLGNLAGFAGPYLVGLVKDATGGYVGSLLAFALLMLAGAALALALRRPPVLRAPG